MDMDQTLEAIRTFQEAWAAFTQSSWIQLRRSLKCSMLSSQTQSSILNAMEHRRKNTGCRSVSVRTRLSPTTTTSRQLHEIGLTSGVPIDWKTEILAQFSLI